MKKGEWITVECGDNVLVGTMISIQDGYVDFENDTERRSIDLEEVDDMRTSTQEEIDSVKPKETYEDVEIEWVSKMAEVRHPENNKIYNITAKPVGWTLSGWALSGYLHDEEYIAYVMLFDESGMSIKSKATHARFVKVGE